jgi:hypothetical protein
MALISSHALQPVRHFLLGFHEETHKILDDVLVLLIEEGSGQT